VMYRPRGNRKSKAPAHTTSATRMDAPMHRLARHGVRSHPVPVALVGECSMPVV